MLFYILFSSQLSSYLVVCPSNIGVCSASIEVKKSTSSLLVSGFLTSLGVSATGFKAGVALVSGLELGPIAIIE